ncbi:MAG: hypothetical protein KBB86_02785 [Candidatus Pacebacteria bacterium]|nr:hypothetical protein [Candidatus Paceibacterota bacterium]
MSNDNQTPVTDRVGAGGASKSPQGKWYYVEYYIDGGYDPHDDRVLFYYGEAVFILPGGSIAKHILLYFKENIFAYGFSGSITELSLLLPDGQRVTGFKPKSIAHLFPESYGK